MNVSLNPRARLIAIGIALLAVFCARDPRQLAVVWIILGLPLLYQSGTLKVHLRFLLVIVAPLSASLLIVWGLVVGAPPGGMPHSAPRTGVAFALLITLRLIVMGAIIQTGFVALGVDRFASFCAELGLTRDLRIMLMGAVILVPEMKLRASQVFTARCARGLLRTRSFSNRFRQIPGMLRALVAWALRSSVERSEMWAHRTLLTVKPDALPHSRLRTADYLLIAFSTLWLVSTLIARMGLW